MKQSLFIVAILFFPMASTHGMIFKMHGRDFTVVSSIVREKAIEGDSSFIGFRASIENYKLIIDKTLSKKGKVPTYTQVPDKRYLALIEREARLGQHPITGRAIIRGFLYHLKEDGEVDKNTKDLVSSDHASELFNVLSNAYIDQEIEIRKRNEEILQQQTQEQARQRELQKQHLEAIKDQEFANCYDQTAS